MGRKTYKALILVFCCWLASCVKDKPGTLSNATPGSSGNVYIVCEGNFGSGSATLYAYQPLHDSVFGDLYKTVNHQPLGDVFQSMKRIGDQFFLCINNSDKVVVINANNWTLEGIINIPKPRYILPISATKAYVSTLYSNKVYIINPQTEQVTDTITLPCKNPEGMCLYNNTAIICTWDTAGNNIYQVDITNDKIVHSIKVAGYAPQEALLDKDQMLWVMAGSEPERAGTLTRLDPSTGAILQSYYFPAVVYPLKPVFNNTKDTLYFIEANYNFGITNNGIFRMSIYDMALPSVPFVQAMQNQYFYALGIDPLSGYIYIGDPKGFVQKGSVYIYRPDGTQAGSFNVGLGPGHFYFDE
ncbi:MAG: DUF5074 domain-containing protein [Chitinophagales bacterium]